MNNKYDKRQLISMIIKSFFLVQGFSGVVAQNHAINQR